MATLHPPATPTADHLHRVRHARRALATDDLGAATPERTAAFSATDSAIWAA